MQDSNIITSRDNSRLKRARAVRAGRERSLLFIEGVRLAEEALRSPIKVTETFFTEHFAASSRGRSLLKDLAAIPTSMYQVGDQLFDSISDTNSAQGILLLAERPLFAGPELAVTKECQTPIVLLHQVNTPSNLGAIIRTAEAAGVPQLILTSGSADPFSPKSLRASMGSAFRVPIITGATFDQLITLARSNGLAVTGSDISGTTTYTDVDWTVPRLIIFGSEAHGLSEDEKACIDDLITIPMDEPVESLNLAVAAGIILFEAARQLRQLPA